MHGQGRRKICPKCEQSIVDLPDTLASRELQGPRDITSSNIDKVLDDNGRFLFIEDKKPGQILDGGQGRALLNLTKLPAVTVWLVRGTLERLQIKRLGATPQEHRIICAEGTWDDLQAEVLHWYEINEGYSHPAELCAKCKELITYYRDPNGVPICSRCKYNALLRHPA